VRDVSLDIAPGEFQRVGPTAAARTLLNVAAGLLSPARDGARFRRAAAASIAVSAMFQTEALMPGAPRVTTCWPGCSFAASGGAGRHPGR
jgi:ABC-type taurine transport system ATPase subunit